MKLQSYSYVISINIVMYDWAPEVLLVHVLEWLRVVACDILLRQMMITTFPFQILYAQE